MYQVLMLKIEPTQIFHLFYPTMSSAQDLLIWKEMTKSFAEEIKWIAEMWRAEMFESEMYCGYCSLPMQGGRCNKVCESESYADSPPWACGKCDRLLENGKCKDCEK